MKLKTITLYTFIVILMLFTGFAVYNAIRITGANWVCITDTCTVWATGDDWIIDNCRPNNYSQLICNVVTEQGTYDIPLEELNASKMKSCRERVCVTEVLIRQHGGKEE